MTQAKFAASFVDPVPLYRPSPGYAQSGRVSPVGKFYATRGSNGDESGNGELLFGFAATISSGATPCSTHPVIADSIFALKSVVSGPPQCAIFGIINKRAKFAACPIALSSLL